MKYLYFTYITRVPRVGNVQGKTERSDLDTTGLLLDAGLSGELARRVAMLISAGHAGEAKALLATQRFALVDASRRCHRQLLSLDTVIAQLNA